MSWLDPYDVAHEAYEEAAEEEAYYAEREREEEWQTKQDAKMDAFDDALDAYQERQREMAAELEEQGGNREAVRPDAIPLTITFADLVTGDYITAETGPHARWVKVVKIEARRKGTTEDSPDKLTVTFQTAQPIGVAMEDHWVIERHRTAEVVIDQRARPDADRTAGQVNQLATLHARDWTITTHETDDQQRLRVTGTQPDGTHFRGWLDADGQFTGQPTDPSRSTQRFGVGAPGVTS